MIVRMMIHSNTIHLTNHIAALRNGFVPDRRNSELGSSADRSLPGMGLLRAIVRGCVSRGDERFREGGGSAQAPDSGGGRRVHGF